MYEPNPSFLPLQSFQGKYRHAVEKVVKRRRGELKGSQVYGFKTPKPDGRSAAARRQVKIDERGKGKTSLFVCLITGQCQEIYHTIIHKRYISTKYFAAFAPCIAWTSNLDPCLATLL